MYSDNKQIRDVADVAARIMAGLSVTEKLHPNQQVLDVHEPEKDELTADDFKKLRGKKEVKKEEVEHLNEDPGEGLKSIAKKHGMEYHPSAYGANMSHAKKGFVNINRYGEWSHHKEGRSGRGHGPATARGDEYKDLDKHLSSLKENVESIDEVKMADLPSTKVQGRSYGASKPESDYVKGPSDAALKKIEAEKKQKKFSEMVNLYQDKGLKSLSEMLAKEESTEDEFNKELEDAKAKDAGKKKNTEIAKGAVQAVKTEETEVVEYALDVDAINGVAIENIEERHMTEPETKKKEEIVKGMKKGLSGFKDRYGDRAKSVMYATATKNAKGE